MEADKIFMDYLDPKKKRNHKVQLLLGYGLFAVAIAFATVLLVYLANGYYVDSGTGKVIQNGLVYVDSKPGGAQIFINGVQQRGTTDARLVLAEGDYEIKLQRQGYREWSRSLLLEGGSLRRLTYPRLIPTELTPTLATNLKSNPIHASQSVDKRWIILSYNENPLALDVIDTLAVTTAPVSISIPAGVVAAPIDGTVEIVEWADDDRTFIAKYTDSRSTSYLLVDRENPGAAQNLNSLFGDSSFEIGFQDRKRDNFFVYQPGTNSLLTANLTSGVAPTPFVVKAIQYETFGRDWVLYVTESDEEGLVEARFKRGENDILLKKIKTADAYLLQLAKLANAPVMGVSSPVENRAIIFNDPEKYLNENQNVSIPIATTVLRVNEPVDLRISTDSSIIMAYGAESFASHEFEADRSYTFKVETPIDPMQKINWVDGQHFLFSVNGKQVMMDFDGSNMYELVASTISLGSFFTDDTENMFTFTPAIAATDATVAQPSTLSVTSLLTPADR